MTNEETKNALSHLTAKVNRIDCDLANIKHPLAAIDPLNAAIDAAVRQLTTALVERHAVSNKYLRLLARSSHRAK